MPRNKYVIFTPLFEFGGSNTYLKLLDRYLATDELVIVFDHPRELPHYEAMHFDAATRKAIVVHGLHKVAKIQSDNIARSLKQTLLMLSSILKIVRLLIRLGTRNIIISSVDPEKYLYLFLIPFISVKYTVHTVPAEQGFGFSSWLCNHCLGKQKVLLTVSNFSKREICKFWNISSENASNIRVIYNTIVETPRIESNVWREDSANIITLGHTVVYKNPALWLRVAKRVTALHPAVQFKWIGNGPLLDEFVSATRDLDRIEFLGASDTPQQYFGGCYLYYQPSDWESHGIAVLEALASGLPCVVSSSGGLPESIESSFNGFVVDNTMENDHVEAITRLLSDHHLAAQMSVNARQRFEEKFGYLIWKSKMDQLFQQAV